MRRWLSSSEIWFESLRFAIVGIKSNILYYALYVLLSLMGTPPKVAVTMVFLFGIAYTFWFNKSFVFRNKGAARRQVIAYVGVYLVAWALNLLLLEILVTHLQLNHYLVQAALIFVIAILIFLSLKLLVFGEPRKSSF
jgi:putative flippase GtrA